MPTPRKGYFLKDGKRVPSVTQITGRYGDKEALLGWYRKMGKMGLDPEVEKNRAAEIGTYVHAWVEEYLNPEAVAEYPFLDTDQSIQAANAIKAFSDWASDRKLRVLEQEVRLVSEFYKYGGTLDCVAEVDGQTCLFDWKTSKAVYPEMRQQIAAYAHVWNENVLEKPISKAHLIRIGKDGAIEPHEYDLQELNDDWNLFKLFRECYLIQNGV